MHPMFENLFVFEMANNHQGEIAHGVAIIEAMAGIARRHSIRAAIKLQYRNLDTFIHPAYVGRADVKHIGRFLSTRLPDRDMLTLLEAAKANGLLTMVTPFDEASVDLALAHDVDILKVASCSATDWPLLERIAAAGKPTIGSTGGRTFRDIDRIVNFFEHRNVSVFGLLHCIGIYPAPIETIHLGYMRKMIQRYPNVTIGYSAHEGPDELDVVRAAVAMGAQILERHVGLATDQHKLNTYSLGPDQVEQWVAAAQRTRLICHTATKDKVIPNEEAVSLRELSRGVFASRAVKRGETLDRSSVYFAMPITVDSQCTSGDYAETIVASRDYEKDAPILDVRDESAVRHVRDIVHEAKAMLSEARVALGKEFSIELSHHYGIESFREVGVILIDLVNREYCKKLGVMLPGQRHPTHRHVKKEETFQILHGDLTLVVEGQTHKLTAGDLCLVGRGQRHSFSSSGGCIFEEVSTTSIRGDSIYDDQVVARLDPMQRKTVLETW